MRIRSFRVPFSRVVPNDAHEVEYGPGDYMVVRPLFGLPAGEAQEWAERIADVRRRALEASDSDDPKKVEKAGDALDALVVAMIDALVVEWNLEAPDGSRIAKPEKPADLAVLPLALRHGLFPFMQSYRGDAPDPTTSS